MKQNNLSLSDYSFWLGTVPYTPTHTETNAWYQEVTRYKHPEPLCKEDYNMGYGITLDSHEVNNELLTRLISEFQDYIWVREHGFLQCVHYTGASLEQLKGKGLQYPQVISDDDLCVYTFTAGIYVYNIAQHSIDNKKPHVLFNYYGDYYKCIYDCDPQEYSKDIGVTQEYLIPSLNIPYNYLDISGLTSPSSRTPKACTFDLEGTE